MFKFIEALFEKPNTEFTGALVDPRSANEKENDVSFGEIVGQANAVSWSVRITRNFPTLDQYRSYTCGANALAKAIGITFYTKYRKFLEFCREQIYQKRTNTTPGMYLSDMLRIAEEGVTLNSFMLSEPLTDNDYVSTKIERWMTDVGKTFSTSKGIYIPNDIDIIASIINTTGKGVIILQYFTASEYSREVPIIENRNLDKYSDTTLRHFVVAVDYTLLNGQKCLKIEDSAHFGGLSTRYLTEDWIKNRMIDGAYLMNFKFEQGGLLKPSYDGMTIISAQMCLKYEGLFPSNISFIENIGPVTKKSLIDFQNKYSLTQTGTLSSETINKLQYLYP